MDKKNILNGILWKKSKDNSSGLLVSTPFQQLNTKNSIVKGYPMMTNDVKNDIYGSNIQDISWSQKSSRFKDNVVWPQSNWWEIWAAQMAWSNKTVTFGKQPADILMHEQLHNQFYKDNPNTRLQDDLNNSVTDINSKYPRLNESMAEWFDNDYNKYLSKNSNKSDKTIKKMKYIEWLLSQYYTEPGKSSKAPLGYDYANERYAYLWMNPDLIPKDLKKYYKWVYK